jgi:hypothetical protein
VNNPAFDIAMTRIFRGLRQVFCEFFSLNRIIDASWLYGAFCFLFIGVQSLGELGNLEEDGGRENRV